MRVTTAMTALRMVRDGVLAEGQAFFDPDQLLPVSSFCATRDAEIVEMASKFRPTRATIKRGELIFVPMDKWLAAKGE